MITFARKIWVLIVVFLVITIAFMYLLTDFLYEQLYVEDTEASMIEYGERLVTKYKGGQVTDELIAEIEEHNSYGNFSVFAVRNPRELSACVPFDIDYETLIGPDERQQLLAGQAIIKIGYEERFERQIISVIFPFTDENRLEGILYLYYPLAKISELAKEEVFFLIACVVVFAVVIGYFVFKALRHIMRPLHELQQAVQQMSTGDYTARVSVTSKDEIGQLSKAFNDMAQAIQQEDEEKKTFLATVSHELRTPISYVKGYSESIQNGFIEGEQKEEAIRLIAREANRMERLTNELMQLVHVEEEQAVEMYPIVLAETLRDAIQIIHVKAKEKQIDIMLEADEELIVEADEEKLKQILINLLENAIRYSDEKKTVRVEARAHEKMAVMKVIDKGIGIPQEDLPKITERFYRVNKARSRADGGSGLGLSIVDKLVKQHQGTLHIESKVGEGTVVTVQIPLMEE
ncbi:ATP-binding protein [Lysinibacillus sp. KU-BSD001]|uniref:sensor histidine kinase n=1 Tax=Lysinibacillus sp. KU-BSD001 TaxID=3141328 RepID=UPI0036F0A26B